MTLFSESITSRSIASAARMGPPTQSHFSVLTLEVVLHTRSSSRPEVSESLDLIIGRLIQLNMYSAY